MFKNAVFWISWFHCTIHVHLIRFKYISHVYREYVRMCYNMFGISINIQTTTVITFVWQLFSELQFQKSFHLNNVAFDVVFFFFIASFSQYCNITMLKCQIVFYLLHYYIRNMYLSLQHSNIPMKKKSFVIYCVGVKLWTHINVCIMSFVLFVIYMYAVQKRETI